MHMKEYISLGEARICILAENANQRSKMEYDLYKCFDLKERPIQANKDNYNIVVRGLREPLLIVHEGNMDQYLATMLHIGRQWTYAIKLRQP